MFISNKLSRLCSTKWDILSQGQFVQGQSETNAINDLKIGKQTDIKTHIQKKK